MALMDYVMYGETKGLGAKNRFTRYLRRYVAGKSTEKYEQYSKSILDKLKTKGKKIGPVFSEVYDNYFSNNFHI